MKIPDIVGSLFHKKAVNALVYLSLCVDVHDVAASFWSMGSQGTAHILASEFSMVDEDSWETRTSVIDRLLGLLEQKTGHTDVTKVILGLPATYLTETGEICKDIRSEVKKLTQKLELEPMGFVPLHQAVIFKMKKDEGVPPSVILLGINQTAITISIYKIGSYVGLRDIEKHGDIALAVEQGLKSFTDLEVLPARMLLYGSQGDELEEIKGKLLRHQWTSNVNFLHFPKIDVITAPMIIEAVSLAGSSELSSAIGEVEEPESAPEPTEVVENQTHVAIADSTPEVTTSEVAHTQEVIAEDFAVDETASQGDANVVMVDAESLGFKKDVDILEEEEQINEVRTPITLPRIDVSGVLGFVGGFLKKIVPKNPRKGMIAGIVGFAVLLLILYWVLPHATVTILEIPKNIEAFETITIDPTATIVDAEHKIIPGKKREKSISGDKTVPVTGKKSIGDPAKGTVTIYNKTPSQKLYKKSTILLSGSLQFTLDEDVQVASASESVGSITFGKGDASVTAVAIGTASNLATSSEFTLKDVSSGAAVARNDKAFTGGTSKEVTVVTRADYDAFVKAMTDELVGKAKEDLSTSVTGSEKLIDSTIKTAVTEKVFAQEIDQEANLLQGKITLTVSGIAYSQTDIRALLTTVSAANIPSGYMINEEKTTTSAENVKMNKDGSMSAKATMKAVAVPTFEIPLLQKTLAGKSMKSAEDYLRTLPGVGGVEVGFRLSPTKSRMPINKKNISVIVSVL